MVEVEIFGLALDENSKSPILVLKDGEGRAVPIWIGAMEAMSISAALNNVSFPRPMTHDLLLNTICDMGGSVTRVEVTAIEEGTFYAAIVVAREGGTIRIDSRPSDAIALAVRAKSAILVEDLVFELAGAPIIEGAEAVIRATDSDKWADELDKLSVADIKYKM